MVTLTGIKIGKGASAEDQKRLKEAVLENQAPDSMVLQLMKAGNKLKGA